MKHHIIVKFNDRVTDKPALIAEVEKLFSGCTEVGGVHGCEIHRNCTARDNRYDLMIVLNMDKEALPAWDDCRIHHEWKDIYGGFVEKKAIFDCE